MGLSKLISILLGILGRGRDISIELHGSSLTFTKEGDIVLEARRALITKSKLIFLDTEGNSQFIAETIEAYEEGPQYYREYVEERDEAGCKSC